MHNKITGNRKLLKIGWMVALSLVVILLAIPALQQKNAKPASHAEQLSYRVENISSCQPDSSDLKKHYGDFVIYLKEGESWREAGKISADKFPRQTEIPLSLKVIENEQLTLKIVEKGAGAAHLDLVQVNGRGPVEINGKNNTFLLKKLSKQDNDVIDAREKTYVMTFPIEKDGSYSLHLSGRIEGERLSDIPFKFPPENTYSNTTNPIKYYRYAVSKKQQQYNADGVLREVNGKKAFFKEFCKCGSGHPNGFTYGWVSNDDKNLYVSLDFTPDNTMDGTKDYAEVMVRTSEGVKHFKASTTDRKWGTPGFTYTDKVNYQHKVYEFKIPFKELGMEKPRKGNIDLAFSAYGTAAPLGSRSYPKIAYDPFNARYLVVYTKSFLDGSVQKSHVFGQFYTPCGQPVGEEFDIDQSEDIFSDPQGVVFDYVNKRFLVIYTSTGSGSETDLYGRFVKADISEPIDSSRLLVAGGEGRQYYASVAFDGNNQKFMVIFSNQPDNLHTTEQIKGIFINADGSTPNPADIFPVSTVGDYREKTALAFDSVNNRYLAVWEEGSIYLNTDTREIKCRYLPVTGEIQTPQPEDVLPIATMAENPAVAFSKTTNCFLVVFEQYNPPPNYSVYIYSSICQYGQPPSGPIFIAITYPINFSPSIVYSEDTDKFLVTWYRSQTVSGLRNIWGQWMGSDGSRSGSNFNIATSDADNYVVPEVAYNPTGKNIMVAYESFNDSGLAPFSVLLTLIGPANTPIIYVEPGSKDFGDRQVNQTSPEQEFTVNNINCPDLTFTATITGDNPDQFDFASTPFLLAEYGPQTVPSGETRKVRVVFKPTSNGQKQAKLHFSCNDPEHPEFDIPLYGNGTGTGPTPTPTRTCPWWPPYTGEPPDDPTCSPTEEPTCSPTEEPTCSPTEDPTCSPTVEPTDKPTSSPTGTPSPCPTGTPQPYPVPPCPPPGPAPSPSATRTPDSPSAPGRGSGSSGGGGCFLFAIARDSYQEEYLDTMRAFRDRYMKTNPMGNRITALYYEKSPQLVAWVNEHPQSRGVLRLMMMPAYGAAAVAVRGTSGIPLLLLPMLLTGFLIRRRQR